jgi:hypothetical protein
MKAVLIAGFSPYETSEATRLLLESGICVVAAPTLGAAIERLRAGGVDIALVKSGEAARRVAQANTPVPLLPLDAAIGLDSRALMRLIEVSASRPDDGAAAGT